MFDDLRWRTTDDWMSMLEHKGGGERGLRIALKYHASNSFFFSQSFDFFGCEIDTAADKCAFNE
jgi:hypothetical protein